MIDFDHDKYVEFLETEHMDVYIPHHARAEQLGRIYNEVMSKASGWVLFIDSDVFLLHPKWYDIFMRAIYTLGDEAGFISCLTNRIGHRKQKYDKCESDDLKKHTDIAITLEKQCRRKYVDVTDDKGISGHVILTHHDAWSASRGFKEGLGVLGTDNSYHYAVRDAGYKVYVMHDQYVYHRYARFWKRVEFKSGEWDK